MQHNSVTYLLKGVSFMRQILPCMDVHRYICIGYRAVLYHKSSAGGTYQEDDTGRGAEEQRVKHLL